MKVQIISDLHLEFGSIDGISIERDLLIIAGDVDIGKKALSFIKNQLKISPVIYILGNHEFYNNDFDEIMDFWKNINLPDFYFLENSSVILNGIKFIGATLWTDMNKGNISDIKNAKLFINDFNIIKKNERLFNQSFIPQDAMFLHKISVDYIINELEKKGVKKTVIITHHLPTYLSVHDKFKKDVTNHSFYTDLNDLIMVHSPNFWIHGHTHESYDYRLHNTRIICNPRGYKHCDLNESFNPKLILEI